jgi:actin-related protein
LSESLFNPKEYTLQAGNNEPTLSLQEAIVKSVNMCDVDLRHQLLGNIVLTGGTSSLNGLSERLQTEVMSLAPSVISKGYLNVRAKLKYRLQRQLLNVNLVHGLVDLFLHLLEHFSKCGYQSRNTKNMVDLLSKSDVSNLIQFIKIFHSFQSSSLLVS